MKVKCVDNYMMEKRLTVGKVYEVLAQDASHYRIVCDDGAHCNANGTRFVTEKAATQVVSPSSQEVSDWRAWQHKAPGECVCGIPKTACDYHR